VLKASGPETVGVILNQTVCPMEMTEEPEGTLLIPLAEATSSPAHIPRVTQNDPRGAAFITGRLADVAEDQVRSAM